MLTHYNNFLQASDTIGDIGFENSVHFFVINRCCHIFSHKWYWHKWCCSADSFCQNNVLSLHIPILRLFFKPNEINCFSRWRFGFPDKTAAHTPGGKCAGPFIDSSYCSYGAELDCYIFGQGLEGADIHQVPGIPNASSCQAICLQHKLKGLDDKVHVKERDDSPCHFWVWSTATSLCKLKSTAGTRWPCPDCVWGPASCPLL